MLAPSAKLCTPPSFQAVHLSAPSGLGLQQVPCSRKVGSSCLLFSLKMMSLLGELGMFMSVSHTIWLVKGLKEEHSECGSEFYASVVIWETIKSPWEHGTDFTGAPDGNTHFNHLAQCSGSNCTTNSMHEMPEMSSFKLQRLAVATQPNTSIKARSLTLCFSSEWPDWS